MTLPQDVPASEKRSSSIAIPMSDERLGGSSCCKPQEVKSKKQPRQSLPTAAVNALQRYASRATSHASATVRTSLPEQLAQSRHLSMSQCISRMQRSCAAEPGEGHLTLPRQIVQCIVEVAQLSAEVAAICTRKGGRQNDEVRISAAVKKKRLLECCLEALRAERTLSSALVNHVGSLCWHTAWRAAWKDRLSKVPLSTQQRRKALVDDVEFQRRLDDLRSELAKDTAQAAVMPPEQNGWRGVNLGGWLLWERGPCDHAPVVRAVGEAPMDEWTLSQRLRESFGDAQAESLMRHHRETFITKTDFERIAALGLNSVRIPFGYWIIDGPRPGDQFLGPAVDILDKAFKWAEETGLKVVLCYHGTVGSQSDHQASGRFNEDWKPKDWDTDASLNVLGRVGARYATESSFGGICVVNEPSPYLPLEVLRKYYKDAYRVVREAGVPVQVQVILPLYFQKVKDFQPFFSEKDGYHNVVFDSHIYQVFGDDWFNMSIADHLRWASAESKFHEAKEVGQAGARLIISEWCLALPTRNFCTMIAWEWMYLTQRERTAVVRSFALRQLRTWAKYASDGWFFWSWKDEDSIEWSLEEAVSKRLISFDRNLLPMVRSAPLAPPAMAAKWHHGRTSNLINVALRTTELAARGAPKSVTTKKFRSLCVFENVSPKRARKA